MMNIKELEERLEQWVRQYAATGKYPIWFADYPEVNEGLEMLIEVYRLQVEHRKLAAALTAQALMDE